MISLNVPPYPSIWLFVPHIDFEHRIPHNVIIFRFNRCPSILLLRHNFPQLPLIASCRFSLGFKLQASQQMAQRVAAISTFVTVRHSARQDAIATRHSNDDERDGNI
jgi:hypothetical protein